jgi:hypothetical protein
MRHPSLERTLQEVASILLQGLTRAVLGYSVVQGALHCCTSIVGPANQNGCIILCVGNLADEKFQAFNEISCMKFLETIVNSLTELLPNHCQHRGNLYHNYIFK